MNKEERIKKRRSYIFQQLKNIPKHLRSKEIKRVAKQLFLSESQIYNDLQLYKYPKEIIP